MRQSGTCAAGRDWGVIAPMDQFIAKHADQIEGTLSCFDRVIFRGYLPFFGGVALASVGDG